MSEERDATPRQDAVGEEDDEFEIAEDAQDDADAQDETGTDRVSDAGGTDAGPTDGGGQGPEGQRAGQQEARPRVDRRRTSDEIRDLRARARRAEQESALFKRQFEEVLQARQTAESERRRQEEEQALQFMSPEQRVDYRTRQTEERIAAQIRAVQVNLWENQDRDKYERELEARPNYRRFEKEVDELRRQYPTVSRVDLLRYAVGDAVLRNEKPARTRASNGNAAAERLQQASPPATRSGVSVERQRQGPSLDERLRGQLI